MKTIHWAPLAAAILLTMGAAACSDDPAGLDPDGDTRFLSVVPEGGATDVDPDGPIEVRFDHPMMAGMEDYALLHLGEVTGPAVTGSWSFSDDHTVLTFRPHAPLEPGTLYTIHLGGGMMDADSHPVDWGTHGPGMGGMWAGETMMGSAVGPGGGMWAASWARATWGPAGSTPTAATGWSSPSPPRAEATPPGQGSPRPSARRTFRRSAQGEAKRLPEDG